MQEESSTTVVIEIDQSGDLASLAYCFLVFLLTKHADAPHIFVLVTCNFEVFQASDGSDPQMGSSHQAKVGT